ncbi:hypothetical protein BH11PAT1_BH11PAT1_6590 [soil metagenome]
MNIPIEWKIILAVLASIMALIGNLPYLLDVIKGKIKPHPYTWFIWSIVSAITFFGGVAKGAGIGALPTGIAEGFTIIIFFFSLKNGFSNVTRTDTYFLIAALSGLIPWILTKDPTISVIVAVGIDLIAFVPTFRKTWQDPKTENPILFIMNVTRHGLTLLSLSTYNIATMLHSIAMIITNSCMTFIIFTRKKHSKSK